MLKWLEMVRKRESGELTKPQQPVVPISRRGPDKEYSRYKQEDFKATGITGSFNIDTRGTNASKSFNSLVAGNKRYVINNIFRKRVILYQKRSLFNNCVGSLECNFRHLSF